MKKSLLIISLIASALLATGCASIGSVEDIQSQIDTLKPVVTNVAAEAETAKAAATVAAERAASAEQAAKRAAFVTQSVDEKLANMVEKSKSVTRSR